MPVLVLTIVVIVVIVTIAIIASLSYRLLLPSFKPAMASPSAHYCLHHLPIFPSRSGARRPPP